MVLWILYVSYYWTELLRSNLWNWNRCDVCKSSILTLITIIGIKFLTILDNSNLCKEIFKFSISGTLNPVRM